MRTNVFPSFFPSDGSRSATSLAPKDASEAAVDAKSRLSRQILKGRTSSSAAIPMAAINRILAAVKAEVDGFLPEDAKHIIPANVTEAAQAALADSPATAALLNSYTVFHACRGPKNDRY
jgi:hypothetical protein